MQIISRLPSVVFLTSALGATAVVPAAATDGKNVFMAEKCQLCHSVQAAGIEAQTRAEQYRGQDLSGYRPGRSNDLKETLYGGNRHPQFKGSDEELQALFDWLISL